MKVKCIKEPNTPTYRVTPDEAIVKVGQVYNVVAERNRIPGFREASYVLAEHPGYVYGKSLFIPCE